MVAPTAETTGSVSLRMPFAASSAYEARRRLDDWLTRSGFSDAERYDARLILSELVGNAVRHARPLPDGSIVISWRGGEEGVELSVTDGGAPSRPQRVNAGATAVSGRGLAIIEEVATRWWSEQSRSRSTVSALLAVS